MTAFNAVRFQVKPGRDQEFLDAHKKVQANWPGLIMTSEFPRTIDFRLFQQNRPKAVMANPLQPQRSLNQAARNRLTSSF
jgi:hypothetical protein